MTKLRRGMPTLLTLLTTLATTAGATAVMATPLWPNRGGLSPHVRSDVPDQQILGPAGFTLHGDAIFLADPLASRALHYDGRMRPRAAWRFALAPQDLLIDGRGRLCAIDAGAVRVECRASADAPGPAVARRLPDGSIALVPGPSNAVWALRGDGFAGPAWGGGVMQRATPLDMRAHWQAAGMWRGPALGEVLIWPWSALPDAKGVEPSRTLAVRAPAGQRLGSVRPLRMDADGRLFVAVEWLAGERRLEVTQQVLQIDGADRRRAVQWRAATYAPGLQGLDGA